MQLREYQSQAVRDIRDSIARGNRSIVLVLPTGAGKSAIATAIAAGADHKGKRVMFLAPRRELIYQISDHFNLSDVDHGVMMAGERPSFIEKHQIACIPTLARRCFRDGEVIEPSLFGGGTPIPGADLVIVDEAHIGVGCQAQTVIEHYKQTGAVVLGLTATPARKDGRGLGAIYDDMVIGPTVRELTEQGYLVPARYFGGATPDLEGVKMQAGDYNQKQIGERANEPVLVGDIVSNWCRIASERQTFVFAVDVAHSKALCEQFKAAGVKAEHLDGKTENDERKEIQERLRKGETQVIVNCQVMTYGVDFPPVSCIVLATPTKSVTKYFQSVGRGLRPCDGKTDCLVLDHSGVVDELGFIDDDMPWSLDGKEKVQERKASEKKEPENITCDECSAVFRPARRCPVCGHLMESKYKRVIEAFEADLVEINRKEKFRETRKWSIDDKARFFGELRSIAKRQGYRDGWAAYKYKAKLGVWPNDPRIKRAPMVQPTPETESWVKSQTIKWAKSKDRKAA